MKRILLASTAIVGFAGAAAADGHAESGISFSGDASLEWNSETDFDWGADININMTQALDNGLVVAVDWEIDFTDDNLGNDLNASDFVLSLTSETSGLYFGDTGMAADSKWSAVGDMEADDFSSTDEDAVVLRGEMSFGDVDAAISYVVDNTDDLEQLSIGVAADFGGVSVTFGYQEEVAGTTLDADDNVILASGFNVGDDFDPDEVIAISASTTFGGADVALGYASNETEGADSLGLSVDYPVNDMVTVGFYYVSESAGDDNYGVSVDYSSGPLTASIAYEDEQGTDGFDVAVDYDLGNGLVLFAGYEGEQDDDGHYIGATYDLGGGADIRLVHTETDGPDTDDLFDDEDPLGTTLTLSFSF